MRCPVCLKVSVLVAVLLLASPPAATAQTASPPTPVSLKLPPGITMSGGGGVMTGRNSGSQPVPVFTGSVEVALNRFMLAQVEAASGRWDSHSTHPGRSVTRGGVIGYTGDYLSSEQRRKTDLVGNFLGRAGAGRVHALFGVGFGLGLRAYEYTSTVVGCIPVQFSPCPTSDPHGGGSHIDFVQQFVAGVDVRLTPRLTAYATFRARTFEDQEKIMLIGLRATVRRAPVGGGFPTAEGKRPWKAGAAPRLVAPADAIGKEVHVVALDHSRKTGWLVSIDDTQVTIRRSDGAISMPLKEVQGVRLASHVFLKSTMIGLGVGFGTGLVYGSRFEEGGSNYAIEGALMFGGIGAGVGAAIGAVANLTGAGSRTVYIGPGKTALNLAPLLGKGRAGFTGLLSW